MYFFDDHKRPILFLVHEYYWYLRNSLTPSNLRIIHAHNVCVNTIRHYHDQVAHIMYSGITNGVEKSFSKIASLIMQWLIFINMMQ